MTASRLARFGREPTPQRGFSLVDMSRVEKACVLVTVCQFIAEAVCTGNAKPSHQGELT